MSTLNQNLLRSFSVHAQRPFIATWREGCIVWKTYAEIFQETLKISFELKRCLPANSIVGICSDNRPEWIISDFSCCLNSFMTVGLHSCWETESIIHVLKNSQINCIICEAKYLTLFSSSEVTSSCPSLSKIVVIGELPSISTLSSVELYFYNIFLESDSESEYQTQQLISSHFVTQPQIELLRDQSSESDPYTLLYTSGTTGTPKGVSVSRHRWTIDAQRNGFANQKNPCVLSYMSLAHGGDRGICWQACFAGARIGFPSDPSLSLSSNLPLLLETLSAVQPTFFLGMSHLWSDLYSQFKQELEALTLQEIRDFLVDSVRTSLLASTGGSSPSSSSISSLSPESILSLAQLLDGYQELIQLASSVLGIRARLLLDWNQRMGGKIFIPVTGGAHTSPEVIAWMSDLFQQPTATNQKQFSIVKDAYGTSEFPGISVNGEVSLEVEVKLVPVPSEKGSIGSTDWKGTQNIARGEIWVRHKDRSVRSEYWRDPEATSKSFKEGGWYLTGDLGEWDYQRRGDDGGPTLRIVDRVANVIELYVNGDSVWVEQSRLEAQVYSNSQVAEWLCLCGDRNQDCLLAIVSPRWSVLEEHLGSSLSDILDAFRGKDEQSKRKFLSAHPLVKDIVLQSLVCAAHSYTSDSHSLQSWEIPRGVILDWEEWTPRNGLLTATFKPKRDKLKQKFRSQIEQMYADLAHGSSSPSMPITSACSQSPETESESSPQSSESSLLQLSAALTSSSCIEPVSINFPAVFEVSGTLPSYFLPCFRSLCSMRGPESVKNLGLPLGWGGYLVQDSEKLLPPITNSQKKDYLTFEFSVSSSPENTIRLNTLLAVMREETVKRREVWGSWMEENRARVDQLKVDAALERSELNRKIEEEIVHLREIVPSHPLTSDVSRIFDYLYYFLNLRLSFENKFEKALEVVEESPDMLESLSRYCKANEELRILAPRFGVRIPLDIEYGSWFSSPDSIIDPVAMVSESGLLSQSLGDAKVTCCLSGQLIEENLQTSGRPRLHCLDLQDKNLSMDSWALRTELLEFIVNFLQKQVPGSSDLLSCFQRSLPFNPANLTSDELLYSHQTPKPISSHESLPTPSFPSTTGHLPRNPFWVEETAHFWQLRQQCDLDLKRLWGDFGPYVRVDSPAGLASRVFNIYGNRLSLGIPNPLLFSRPLAYDSSEKILPPNWPCLLTPQETKLLSKFPEIVQACGCELVQNRDFLWLTYRDLGRMAMKVARIIRSLVPRGSFVGISGHNGFEWAACDLGCALAGCVSVGIHSTYDLPSVRHVCSVAEISLLFCSSDKMFSSDSSFWNVESLLQSLQGEEGSEGFPLRHVLAMDQSCATLSSEFPDRIARLSSLVPSISLSSLIDLLVGFDSNSQLSQIELEDPDSLPSEDENSLFTLLFTSGSTGKPKAVMVSRKGFLNDISSRSFQEPLITASYIPLSHSSDRMKMWEFLGNGGRVGFVFFPARHWLDHETSKKSEAVQGSFSCDNGVSVLFGQVQRLGPSAFACPPNIAHGLYYTYLSFIESNFNGDPQSAPEILKARGREIIASYFGRYLKFLVTGGGPTSPQVFEFLNEALVGVSVRDSYGATECGGITSNGVPIIEKGVLLRIGSLSGPFDPSIPSAEDPEVGEAWVSSDNMSVGYYKDPEQSKGSFLTDPSSSDEFGNPRVWYRTGDLVRVVQRLVSSSRPQVTIRVLGRTISALSLKGGQVVCPDLLEGVFAVSPFLSQIFISGSSSHSRPAALVWVGKEETLRQLSAHCPSDLEAIQKLSPTEFTTQSAGSSMSFVFLDPPHDETLDLTNICAVLRLEFLRVWKDNGLNPEDLPLVVLIQGVGGGQGWTVESGLLVETLKKNRKAFQQAFGPLMNQWLTRFESE